MNQHMAALLIFSGLGDIRLWDNVFVGKTTYYASSASISSLLNGTSFKALCLVFRGVPW